MAFLFKEVVWTYKAHLVRSIKRAGFQASVITSFFFQISFLGIILQHSIFSLIHFHFVSMYFFVKVQVPISKMLTIFAALRVKQL